MYLANVFTLMYIDIREDIGERYQQNEFSLSKIFRDTTRLS